MLSVREQKKEDRPQKTEDINKFEALNTKFETNSNDRNPNF